MPKLPHTDEVSAEMYDAARVSSFMEDADYGRWRLRHFEVDESEYKAKLVHVELKHSSPERTEREMARLVPPGAYITLQRRMTEQERRAAFEERLGAAPEKLVKDPSLGGDYSPEQLLDKVVPEDVAWQPIMSDTPAEILEHAHPLNHATGNVVVTGLGLGCLPHALLAKPEVKRIDIIDIDPDVIELTGSYFLDERVHIWEGSAADPVFVDAVAEQAKGWDYAWHDIWSNIASRNLDPATAEHGIAFSTLFELYDGHMKIDGEQHAWGFEQSQEMAVIEEQDAEREREFIRRLMAADPDERVELTYRRVLRDRLHGIGRQAKLAFVPEVGDGEPSAQIEAMLDPAGGLRAHLRQAFESDGLLDTLYEKIVVNPAPDEPLDRPNRHLEEIA